MPTISKDKVKEILSKAPQGTTPDGIIAGLRAKGYSLEGYDIHPADNRLTLDKILQSNVSQGIQSFFPGKQVGESIGTLGGYLTSSNKENYDLNAPKPLKVVGDVVEGAALVGGLKAPLPSTVLGNAGQFAGLSGASALGEGLSKDNGVGQITTDVAKASAIGGITGGVFGLLGKGLSKIGEKVVPPITEFTTGVPSGAVKEAIASPEAAKIGRTKMSLTEIRNNAANTLSNPQSGLYKNLSDEFATGLGQVSKQYMPDIQATEGLIENAGNITKQGTGLANKAKRLLNEFRISSKNGIADFEKSAVVKGAEKTNIQEALDTINNWTDYTPKGLQGLSERVGALRNFDTPSGSKNSIILDQIYNKIAGDKGIIESLYPELHTLRTNFATNKKMLDQIDTIINSTTKNPKQVQASINNLDNLFKQNKETYINLIRELSQRSGIDILGQIAGTDFQKALPNFIRGLGGGGALGVGAAVLNPYLLLLAPLFSPRAVGKALESAPQITKTAKTLIRSGISQSIGNNQ